MTSMTGPIFVDTNILVYARDAGEPTKQPRAAEILRMLWESRRGRLSPQVLQEYYICVTRKLKPGLARSDARKDVQDLFAWEPSPPTAATFAKAWQIEDRFGLEYNYGSKYWRSFTYGEDTLAGSKLATRGHAYEAYYTFPIVKKILSGEIRYVYMDYNYAGSDTFFGQTGNPDGMMDMMPYVESASDIRISIRYRY